MNASLVIGQKLIPPGVPSPDWSTTIPATSRNGLSSPDGIAFDAQGDLWVADSWNGRILEFQPPFSNNMNASLVIGERDFTTSCNQETRNDTLILCGDSRTLNGPHALAFDSTGDLWVTDTIYSIAHWQSRLLEFKPPFTDGMAASLVVSELHAPSSLAFDSAGNLWLGCVGCTRRASDYLLEYNPPFTKSMTPSNVIGNNATDNTPTGLSFDSAGNLWVVDSNHILGFNAQVHSVAGRTGRIYFENDLGLLAPLSCLPITSIGFVSFSEGVFKFTIQGLPAGGSVKLTITFPDILPSTFGWMNVMNTNPLAGGTEKLRQTPASQVQVNGNNMTLTLTNASQEGVISVVGGPTLSSITTTSVGSTNSTNPPPSGSPTRSQL
jgi:sugar lactone lactonase YvrE